MTDARENMSYRDIKKIVLERIQTDVWPPDSLLPSETDLADEFSSTRTTVNRALRELAEEGLLERKRKAGTRVLNAPLRQARFTIPLIRDEITQTGATYRYSLIKSERRPVPEWLASRLDLAHGADAFHVRCMHYADNKPFQFEDRWILIKSVPAVETADFSRIGPNEWLVKTVPFTDVELTFMATRADQSLSEFLDAQAGDPIFTAERTTWLRSKPVTFAKMYFASGYRMTTRL